MASTTRRGEHDPTLLPEAPAQKPSPGRSASKKLHIAAGADDVSSTPRRVGGHPGQMGPVHMHEVDRQDAVGLSGEELLPCRARTPGCRIDPGRLQDLPHRREGPCRRPRQPSRWRTDRLRVNCGDSARVSLRVGEVQGCCLVGTMPDRRAFADRAGSEISYRPWQPHHPQPHRRPRAAHRPGRRPGSEPGATPARAAFDPAGTAPSQTRVAQMAAMDDAAAY